MSTGVDHSKELLRGTCPEWGAHIRTVLFTSAQIQSRVESLAQQICIDYAGKEVLAVGLFNGAVMFLSHLLRQFTIPYRVDSIRFLYCGPSTAVSSAEQAGAISSEASVLKNDLTLDPAGAHVLLIEELVATGRTLAWISNHLATRNCASIKICALLDKKGWRNEPNRSLSIDYLGFECPDDQFVVGYGMDYAQAYRCLPFIGVLEPRLYET